MSFAVQSRLQPLSRHKSCSSYAPPLLILSFFFAHEKTRLGSLAESPQADLDALHIVYDPIIPATVHLAGQILLRYPRSGGPRLNLIADFLIAAHTSVQADRLAALDQGCLRSYFPCQPILGA